MRLTIAAPGQRCNEKVHCAQSSCPVSTGADGTPGYGKCPAILPDGAACDPNDASAMSDAYAQCFNGKCQIMQASSCK